jgi:hypothetical protein
MKQAITNHGKDVMYYNGYMIAPGDTRLFEVPDPPASAATSEEAPEDPLSVLQRSPLKVIQAELQALTDDELTRLEVLENASATPRKGALEAIAAERLRRAGAQNDGAEQ